MTGAAHGTVTAAAAAGGLALSLVAHHLYDDQCHDQDEDGRDNDRTQIVRKPAHGMTPLLFEFLTTV